MNHEYSSKHCWKNLEKAQTFLGCRKHNVGKLPYLFPALNWEFLATMMCVYTCMCMYKHYYIMYNILPYNGHGAKQWSLYFANVYKKLVDMDVIWALGYPKGTRIFSLLDDTSSYWFSCSYTNSWDMFIAVLQVVHRSWVSHEVRGLFLCFYIFEYLGRLPVYVVGCRNRNMIIVLLLGHRQRKNIRDMWRH